MRGVTFSVTSVKILICHRGKRRCIIGVIDFMPQNISSIFCDIVNHLKKHGGTVVNEVYWQQHLNTPELWRYKANKLLAPGMELYDRGGTAIRAIQKKCENTNHGVIDPADAYEQDLLHTGLMLLGFGIENLLKGALVCKLLGQGGQTQQQIENRVTANHKLIGLAEAIGMLLNDEDRSTLRILEEYILWSGRYPRPKDAKFFFPNQPPTPIHDTTTKRIILDLHERICNLWPPEQRSPPSQADAA